MTFTDLFIRRPVMSSVVSLLILLLGLQALFSLPVRQFPEITNTQITITTTYPGANADLMQGFITVPIQQALASTEGIDYMTSSSTQNTSTVTLILKLEADGDRALTEVLSKMNQVRNILPEEANDPIVTKQVGERFSIMYLGFGSNVMTRSQITDYLVRVVQPRLETINGVANANILGGQTFAMRVWLNPRRLAALGVTPGDVDAAIRANNFVAAPGQIKGDYVQTNINAATSLNSVEEFRELVVAARGDTLIRLKDVAEVELGPESSNASSLFGGKKSVFIGIDPTPAANPITVIDGVRAALPEIERQLPAGLDVGIAYDSTVFIRASIKEVIFTLAEAALIVIVVIFGFLGTTRSTFIPIVTIPLSLVGVMFMLLVLGYSINLLTLLALVLAIGLVVDDAIVVVENIHRHIEEGMKPLDAALRGAREIAGPVIAMTITLAAVYAPIGFVSGLTGALFREFAFTLAGAVIVSGIIALTLSPMMSSRLLRPVTSTTKFTDLLERIFEWFKTHYERLLARVLANRPVVLVVVFTILGGTAFLYMTTQSELAPIEDQGVVFSVTKAPQYANLDYLDKYAESLARLFDSIPEASMSFIINGMPTVNQGFAGAVLKPWSDRRRDQEEILASVQPQLNEIAGLQMIAFSPPSLPGSTGGPPIQFVIKTTRDHRSLLEVMERLQQEALASGMFMFIDSDLRFDNPQVEVSIDSAKANQMGIQMRDIGIALSTLFGGNYVNRFSMMGRSYQVIPQVPREFRLTPEQIERIHVRTKTGTLVPLSTVVTIGQSVQPNALTNFQQLNSATIQGVMFPGRTLGEGLAFLTERADATFPEGFSYDFQGESRQYVQEGATLAIAFIFAVIVIFLVLAAQFESFRDPLIILVSVPMSIFGALLPLNLGVATLNIYTKIGLVTLIGLISKHGILMVEFANRLQEEEGLSRLAAIQKAAGIRLRPILMTTAAMVMGVVPLLFASGAGAASRFDIGLVIAAGMTIGTIFTLFVVPTMYTFIAREHRHEAIIAKRRAAAE